MTCEGHRDPAKPTELRATLVPDVRSHLPVKLRVGPKGDVVQEKTPRPQMGSLQLIACDPKPGFNTCPTANHMAWECPLSTSELVMWALSAPPSARGKLHDKNVAIPAAPKDALF